MNNIELLILFVKLLLEYENIFSIPLESRKLMTFISSNLSVILMILNWSWKRHKKLLQH